MRKIPISLESFKRKELLDLCLPVPEMLPGPQLDSFEGNERAPSTCAKFKGSFVFLSKRRPTKMLERPFFGWGDYPSKLKGHFWEVLSSCWALWPSCCFVRVAWCIFFLQACTEWFCLSLGPLRVASRYSGKIWAGIDSMDDVEITGWLWISEAIRSLGLFVQNLICLSGTNWDFSGCLPTVGSIISLVLKSPSYGFGDTMSKTPCHL